MKNRGRFFTIGLIIVVFILINSFGGAIRFSTDYLWFKEIGYTETFLTKIKAQFTIGIPVFAVLSILLYLFMKNLKKKYDIESEVVDTKNNKKINMWIKIISASISFLYTASIVSTMWLDILEFLNSESFGINDPVFNNDVGFYFF